MITRKDASVASLRYVCPFCHSEAGRKCQLRRKAGKSGLVTTRPKKAPHMERLALVPEWAAQLRAREEQGNGAGQEQGAQPS